MNKLITRFFLVLLMALPIALVSCDDDDDYYPQHPGWVDDGGNGGGNHFTGPLNQYEKALVGDYISDDKPESPFYLTLNSDRTGYSNPLSTARWSWKTASAGRRRQTR